MAQSRHTLNDNVKFHDFYPLFPQQPQRCSCKGNILSDSHCRKITRNTVHSTSISYALDETCAAEEAYSIIHLALDDTHHGWHRNPPRSWVSSGSLTQIPSQPQVGCPQSWSCQPSSSKRLNCHPWQPELFQSPFCPTCHHGASLSSLFSPATKWWRTAGTTQGATEGSVGQRCCIRSLGSCLQGLCKGKRG